MNKQNYKAIKADGFVYRVMGNTDGEIILWSLCTSGPSTEGMTWRGTINQFLKNFVKFEE
jgi:hypothetical protein